MAFGQIQGWCPTLLPTLTHSTGLKNCYFILKFLGQHHFYVENMHTRFQFQKIYTKKLCEIYQQGVAVRKVSQLPTLTPSQELKKFFLPMEILEEEHLYVDYTWEKYQVQKTHTKNDIPNLPTVVVVKNNEENCLKTLTASLGLRNFWHNMKFLAQDYF